MEVDHYSEFMAKATEAVKLMSEAMIAFSYAVSEALVPKIKEIDEAIYKYYQAIGSPYGKGRRGYKKWIKSLAEEEKDDSGT